MKKTSLLIFTILLLCAVFAFCSCDLGAKRGDNNDGDDAQSTDKDKNNGDDSEDDKKGGSVVLKNGQTYFYSDSEIMFISATDSDSTDASYKLMYNFDSIIGKDGYTYIGYVNSNSDNEIIVGYVPERAVSVAAYEALEKMNSASPISESRYLVYADSGKVAIAFDKNEYTSLQTVGYVVDIFYNNFIKDKKAVLFHKGVVTSGTLNLADLQEEIDKSENELRWNKVREKIGDEDIYIAFRGFFETMFTDEIVDLIANNYDVATGLFYASASGKRADGIYPIPEATSVSLSYVLNTGMLNGMGVRYLLPDLAKYKIVYYLKSIQAEDGEFYVSQMPKASIDSNRLGRDRGACLGLLDRLGEKPTYSVGGVTGDGIDAEAYWANLVSAGLVTEDDKPIIYWADKEARAVAGSLRESLAEAVSRVVPTASGTEPFRSHKAFIEWLLAKDPYNNPYTAMSNTSSAASLIDDWSTKLGGYEGSDTSVTYGSKSMMLYNGETLNEILIRWMNDNINSAGLFGKVSNSYDKDGKPVYDGFFGGWGFQNSNGFLKAIGRYNDMKISYPQSRLAAESLLLGINSDEPVTGNILVIFNVWSSLNNLRKNIQNYYQGDDKAELLAVINNGLTRKVVINEETGETKSYAAVAIEKCTNTILAFKKSDGGFGHAIDYSTPTWQGGLKVAIASDNLSDIDAIACSTTYLGNAMSVLFGLDFVADVPMNTASDALRFVDIMLKQEQVVKVDPSGQIPTN